MKNHFLVQLFERLNAASVQYAVLRNYETLPDSLGGSDLDIWVSCEHSSLFFEQLRFVASLQNAKLVSYIDDKECRKICYLNIDSGAQIDVFIGDVVYNKGVLLLEERIVENVLKYNSVNVLQPTVGNVIAVLKEILNNGTAVDKYTNPIYVSREKYSDAYMSHLLSTFSDDFISCFVKAIHEGALDAVASLLQKKARRSSKCLWKVVKKVRKLQRLFTPPGYVVAVLGTDGAGKTTVINAIIPWLEEPFHNAVVYRHLRPSVFPDLGVLLGKREKSASGTVVSNPHAGNASGCFGSLVRLLYYSLDYTFGFLKLVSIKIRTKSCVFLFDRFYYDYYIDQKRLGIKLPKWGIRLVESVVPQPNLILCLGGDPSAIYKRKPETCLEEVRRQSSELLAFCHSRDNAVWIDTTVSKEDSIVAAKVAIMSMMSNRFRKVEIK